MYTLFYVLVCFVQTFDYDFKIKYALFKTIYEINHIEFINHIMGLFSSFPPNTFQCYIKK